MHVGNTALRCRVRPATLSCSLSTNGAVWRHEGCCGLLSPTMSPLLPSASKPPAGLHSAPLCLLVWTGDYLLLHLCLKAGRRSCCEGPFSSLISLQLVLGGFPKDYFNSSHSCNAWGERGSVCCLRTEIQARAADQGKTSHLLFLCLQKWH